MPLWRQYQRSQSAVYLQYMSMSAPISSFSKLSISSNMQSSQEYSRHRPDIKGKGKAIDTEDIPSEYDEGSEPEDEGGEEEVEGVDNVWTGRLFALDHCRQIETDYAFQIAYAQVKYYGVRISTTESRRPRCSCGEENCSHIEWLIEQLARTQRGQQGTTSPSPTQWIMAAGGLGNVCNELKWELREGRTESDTEETDWRLEKNKHLTEQGRQTRGAIRRRMQTRMQEVRDIMATLSPTVTDDYRRDIFELSDQIRIECVKGDLEATVAGVLTLDDDIFQKFNQLVSRDTRATDYFRKMGIEANNILRLMDEYCDDGPTKGRSEQYDVVTTAQKLVNIVDAIKHNLSSRAPLGPLAREEAAKSLVELLTTIVLDRNVDAYQNSNWPRIRKHGESQLERNLYQRLIGSHFLYQSATRQYFILDVLQDLPEAQPFVEQLEVVLTRLDQIGWGPAPLPYKGKLRDIITKLKGGVNPMEPSSSVGKRAAGALDRKAKRMK